MNNKRLLVWIVWMVSSIMLASVVPARAQSNQRIHYKCYLMLSDQREVIHRFVSVAETQAEFEQRLPGEIVYSQDGVTGTAIEKVYQCVPAKQQFQDKQAINLEEKTPF